MSSLVFFFNTLMWLMRGAAVEKRRERRGRMLTGVT